MSDKTKAQEHTTLFTRIERDLLNAQLLRFVLTLQLVATHATHHPHSLRSCSSFLLSKFCSDSITRMNCDRRPKVVFSPLLSKDVVSALKIVVQRHHGELVSRPDQATHEIIPDASLDEEDGDYCRTIQEQVIVALMWEAG